MGSRRTLTYVLLSLIFLLTTFIIFAQINLRKFEREKDTLTKIGLSGFRVEVVSDVPNFVVSKNEIEKFDEILREWGIFEENNFFLHSLERRVSLGNLVIHLTDKQQPYQFVYKGSTDEVINSVGESWDEENRKLDLFFHVSSNLLNNVQLSAINENFNGLILVILYNRTHKGDADYIKKAKDYIDYFSEIKQFPFALERK